MGSLAKSGAYESDAWRSMARFKRRLVLELCVEHGRFWDAVSEVRQRRNIVPRREVPPTDFKRRGTMMRYPEETYRIRDEIIPDPFYEEFTFDWLGFIDDCLVYQPPRNAETLAEFAAFGFGPYPHTFIDPESFGEGRSVDESLEMIAPPIREFRGEDGKFHYEIRRNEYTTEADVRQALGKLAALRKKSPKGGAPKRDQLVAVQCAILYDDDNASDLADGRRKRWTHDKLAKKTGCPRADRPR